MSCVCRFVAELTDSEAPLPDDLIFQLLDFVCHLLRFSIEITYSYQSFIGSGIVEKADDG